MGRSPLALILFALVLLAGGYLLGRASAPEPTPESHPWIVHEPDEPADVEPPPGPLLHPTQRPPPRPQAPEDVPPDPPTPTPEPAVVKGAGEGAEVHVKGGMLKVVQQKGQYTLVKQGPWTEYHANGTRKGEGEYRDGHKHGDWTTWYGDGSLHTKAEFERGAVIGPYQMFDPNGQMTSEILFEKGVRHGLFRRWHANGVLALESNFSHGKAHGEVRTWHANGQPATRGMKEKGVKQGVWSSWGERGLLHTEETYRDGVLDGPVRVYDEHGNLLTSQAAEVKARVDGKYSRLLKRVAAPADKATYGAFKDFGHYQATDYGGVKGIPAGYWVYVYPEWFIWGESTQPKRR